MTDTISYGAVKDSGTRRNFGTGSRRDTDAGKGLPFLVSPFFKRRVAQHCQNGAVKYGPRNWEIGQPLSSYLNSMERHLCDLQEGKRDEDHAAAIAWNIMAYIHTEQMIERGCLPAELDDRTDYSKEGWPKTLAMIRRQQAAFDQEKQRKIKEEAELQAHNKAMADRLTALQATRLEQFIRPEAIQPPVPEPSERESLIREVKAEVTRSLRANIVQIVAADFKVQGPIFQELCNVGVLVVNRRTPEGGKPDAKPSSPETGGEELSPVQEG